MTEPPIDLADIKLRAQQKPNFPEDHSPYPEEVLALIEVAEAAQAFLTTPRPDFQSPPVEWHRTRHNLEHALAKFKEPT